MDIGKTERYVSDLLTVSAVTPDGEEHSLWLALRHMLMAVALYEQMGQEERTLLDQMAKRLQYFFSTKFCLKERKERQEKKSFPPHPLLKVKETERKEEKTSACVCDAKAAFRTECLRFAQEYDNNLLADFYHYWSEENPKTGKMRFQGKRYWDTEKRLRRWVKNQYSNEITAAALRLKRTQKLMNKESATTQQQEQAAAERKQQDAAREQQMAESRQRQMTTDEYATAHPDTFLARRWREQQEKAKTTKK